MRASTALALLAVASCSADAQQGATVRPSAYVRVIDGGTLQVRGETIRISNIDAPELPPHAKCWAEAALAVQAADRLQASVNMAERVSLRRQGKDRYGRTLAQVQLQGETDLGEALVFQGVAAKWTGRRWDWCAAPGYANESGPEFVMGPTRNEPFADWLVRSGAPQYEADLKDAARNAGFAVR